jgi:hypothetical protein
MTAATLNALLVWSLHIRNGDVLDGGHQLTRILLPLLALTTTDAYASPFAARRRARLRTQEGSSPLTSALHNCAVFTIMFQIALVYFTAGMGKVLATHWRDGTAVYYVGHLFSTFSSQPWATLANFGPLIAFATYSTIVLEVAFPFLAAGRRRAARMAALAGTAPLHLNIIPLAGLLNFGLVMIAADFLVLRDEDYRATAATLRRRTARSGRAASTQLRQALGGDALEDGEVVGEDGVGDRPVQDEVGDAQLAVGAGPVDEGVQGGEGAFGGEALEEDLGERVGGAALGFAGGVKSRQLRGDHGRRALGGDVGVRRIAAGDPALGVAGRQP